MNEGSFRSFNTVNILVRFFWNSLLLPKTLEKQHLQFLPATNKASGVNP
jgi:hypothetical protein